MSNIEDIKRLAGLIKEEESVNEDDKVNFIGFNSSTLPLEKAAVDPKNRRSGEIIKMGRDSNGKPYLLVHDAASSGNYMAYWNDRLQIWTIDFD